MRLHRVRRTLRHGRRGREGMTILEVMVALAILAGGLLAMLAMQVSAMRQGRMGRDHTQAALVAQTQVEFLQRLPFANAQVQPTGWNAGVPVTPPVLAAGAVVPQTYTLQWRINATADPNVRLLDVRVTWVEPNAPPGATPRRYAVSSGLYNDP